MPINAAAILASSSSGREDKAVGPGVGIEVGDCVGAGDGARLGEIVGDKVGPGVGADRAEEHAKGQAIAGFVRSNLRQVVTVELLLHLYPGPYHAEAWSLVKRHGAVVSFSPEVGGGVGEGVGAVMGTNGRNMGRQTWIKPCTIYRR